jgi:hypothetical protein
VEICCSTISSGLNSLAAVIWEDVLKPMSWAHAVTDGQQVDVGQGDWILFLKKDVV